MTSNDQQPQNDYMVKLFIISMMSFLLVEALLPQEYRSLAFLFLVLEATILWVIGMMQSEIGRITTPIRLLATYVALSALLVREEESGQSGAAKTR